MWNGIVYDDGGLAAARRLQGHPDRHAATRSV